MQSVGALGLTHSVPQPHLHRSDRGSPSWSDLAALQRSVPSTGRRRSLRACSSGTKQRENVGAAWERGRLEDEFTLRAPDAAECSGSTVEVSETRAGASILSFGGGGIFFFWKLGVAKYLLQRYDLSQAHLYGASAGALVATLAGCQVDCDLALDRAYDMSVVHRLAERKLGLAGIWGPLVRQWLDDMLPEDAAERCAGRVRVVVTEVPSFKPVYLQDFSSREELINATMASCHVPFFLDWRPAALYKGQLCIDGSFGDFVTNENSDLLQCQGEACCLDYSMDEELQYNRMDFLKLMSKEEVYGLFDRGYAYAARQDKAGRFASKFKRLEGVAQ